MAQETMKESKIIKVKLKASDMIRTPKQPEEQETWLSKIEKYTLGLPLLVMYNQ